MYRRDVLIGLIALSLMEISATTLLADTPIEVADVSEDRRDRWANAHDRELAKVLTARKADWRVGPVVYQVFVDRFVLRHPNNLTSSVTCTKALAP